MFIGIAKTSFFFVALRPDAGSCPPLKELHDHTQTHHTRQYSSGIRIGPTQRRLPDNTHKSHETDLHAFGGIRTRSRSKWAAADPRRTTHGHRDQHVEIRPK